MIASRIAATDKDYELLNLPELIVAGELPFSSVVPQPAIQHALPPASAAVGKQAALTQPSPQARQV